MESEELVLMLGTAVPIDDVEMSLFVRVSWGMVRIH